MLDMLFKGGRVVDGLGTPMYPADVGVSDGRISAVGNLEGAEAARTIDCQGLCVSPGWVDIHGHADWSALDHAIGLNLLIQGCTLTVAGNCGGAPAPMLGRASELLRRGAMRSLGTHGAMHQRHPDATWTMDDYLTALEQERPDRDLEGRSVAAVAAERGIDFEDALFDLALAEGGRGPRFIHHYIEDDHFRTAQDVPSRENHPSRTA